MLPKIPEGYSRKTNRHLMVVEVWLIPTELSIEFDARYTFHFFYSYCSNTRAFEEWKFDRVGLEDLSFERRRTVEVTKRGISSIGRVRALQARGTGIEARILHFRLVL